QDIADFAPEAPYDLVFSNAALHWLPDHAELLARITRYVAEGGQLAVQVPANFDHPSHLVAAEVAEEEAFATALGGYPHRVNVLHPEEYATVLARLGYRDQRVRLEVYLHRLPAAADVVEWVKGTLLTDYAARLPPELYERFVARYEELLLARLDGEERPFL